MNFYICLFKFTLTLEICQVERNKLNNLSLYIFAWRTVYNKESDKTYSEHIMLVDTENVYLSVFGKY